MTKQKILDEGREYTFRSYFDLPYETDQILAEFDYSLTVAELSLPHTSKELREIASLKERITATLPFISLTPFPLKEYRKCYSYQTREEKINESKSKIAISKPR